MENFRAEIRSDQRTQSSAHGILLSDPHPCRFDELLHRAVDVAPVATFGVVNIEQPMANTLLMRWQESHFTVSKSRVHPSITGDWFSLDCTNSLFTE
jgi:hypothetical protein